MAKPAKLEDQIKDLTFDGNGIYDDPLTLRLKDPTDANSPWLVRVCLNSPIPMYDWKDDAKDFGRLTPDMHRQVLWSLERVRQALNYTVEYEFVNDPREADISYLAATPMHMEDKDKRWSGITGGWQQGGSPHKEVLINRFSPEWTHQEYQHMPRYRHHPDNPANPFGHAAATVLHETAHAFGIVHPRSKGPEKALDDPSLPADDKSKIFMDGDNGDYTLDDTLMSYNEGRNQRFYYRKLDIAALQSLYLPENTVDADFRQAPPVSIFHQAKNVAVTASEAAGHTVVNHGPGRVVVKMTREQYNSRRVEERTTDRGLTYYAMTFRDHDDKEKVIHLESDARLAIRGRKGRIEDIAVNLGKPVNDMEWRSHRVQVRDAFLKALNPLLSRADANGDNQWDDKEKASLREALARTKGETPLSVDDFVKRVDVLWQQARQIAASELEQAWENAAGATSNDAALDKAKEHARHAFDTNGNGMSPAEFAALDKELKLNGDARKELDDYLRREWKLPVQALSNEVAVDPKTPANTSAPVTREQGKEH